MLNLNFKQMKKLVLLLVAFVCVGLTMKAQVNLQQGLVAYYPFNGNANDESGNGNNGTVNGATLTTNRYGSVNSAYYFNGINNSILIPNSSSINITSNTITLCAWVNWSGNTSSALYIMDKYSGNYNLALNGNANIGGTGRIIFVTCAGVNTVVTANPISANTWHFIVGVYNGSTMKIYLDGNQIASANQSGNIPSGGDLSIGCYKNCSSTFSFSGQLDDIRIYNRAINEQEIQSLYFENAYNLSFANQTITIGKTIELQINTNELTINNNVISYQFDYNYDYTKLEYIGNSLTGTLGDVGILQVNSTIGKLSIGWARATKIIGTGAIIKLQFKSLATGTTTPTITNAKFNETIISSISNGTITSTILYGDISGNGEVSAYDAALALQYSIGLDPLPTIDPLPWETWRLTVANVDGQSGVTANDATEILKYTVGAITRFTVGKKRGTTDNAEISVKMENGNIVFRSTGDLFGLNVFVNENKNLLGIPQFLNANMLSATNISGTNYAIGLATPNAPKEGEIFMKIPFKSGQNSNITFDMIVNETRKQVTIGLTTGIVEIGDKNISVFPNPANDILYINGLSQNTKVSIYDIFGKMVFSKQITNNQIELNGFQSGVFSIKMENSKGIVTRKFVKK
jgi:hypothetical protein